MYVHTQYTQNIVQNDTQTISSELIPPVRKSVLSTPPWVPLGKSTESSASPMNHSEDREAGRKLVCSKCALDLCGECQEQFVKLDLSDASRSELLSTNSLNCHHRPSNRQVCVNCAKNHRAIHVPILRCLGLRPNSILTDIKVSKKLEIVISDEDFTAFIEKLISQLNFLKLCGMERASSSLIQAIECFLKIDEPLVLEPTDDSPAVKSIIKMIYDALLLKVYDALFCTLV